MRTQNLNNANIFQFDQIYWLLSNEDFYKNTIQILRDRFIFDEVVWSYSFSHSDLPTALEYLDLKLNGEADEYGNRLPKLSYFKNTQLCVDSFRFKEYNPLINPRVHDIGKTRQKISNSDFKKTY